MLKTPISEKTSKIKLILTADSEHYEFKVTTLLIVQFMQDLFFY